MKIYIIFLIFFFMSCETIVDNEQTVKIAQCYNLLQKAHNYNYDKEIKIIANINENITEELKNFSDFNYFSNIYKNLKYDDFVCLTTYFLNIKNMPKNFYIDLINFDYIKRKTKNYNEFSDFYNSTYMVKTFDYIDSSKILLYKNEFKPDVVKIEKMPKYIETDDIITDLSVYISNAEWNKIISKTEKIKLTNDNNCEKIYIYSKYARGLAYKAIQKKDQTLKNFLDATNEFKKNICNSKDFDMQDEDFFVIKQNIWLWIARILWENNKNNEARIYVEEFLVEAEKLNKQSALLESLQILIGRINFEEKEAKENIDILEQYIYKLDDNGKFWALSRIALLYFYEKDYIKAISFFQQSYNFANNKADKSFSLFWEGYSLFEKGNITEAQNKFKESAQIDILGYYEISAMKLLNKTKVTDFLSFDSTKISFTTNNLFNNNLLLKDKLIIAKNTWNDIKLLNNIELKNNFLFALYYYVASVNNTNMFYTKINKIDLFNLQSKKILNHITQKLNENNFNTNKNFNLLLFDNWFAYINKNYKDVITNISSVIFSLNSAFDKKIDYFWLLYPYPYEQEFTKALNLCNKVPKFFAQSIARQESLFQNRVTSGAGAIGIMQLMPYTAQKIAKEKNIKYLNKTDLFEVDINIQLGVCYAEQVLNEFNNNLIFSIASYNAGENAVKSWKKRRYDIKNNQNEMLFIEFIPYNETKIYVQKVLRNLFMYELLYN